MIKNISSIITALWGAASRSDLLAVMAEMCISDPGLNADDWWLVLIYLQHDIHRK